MKSICILVLAVQGSAAFSCDPLDSTSQPRFGLGQQHRGTLGGRFRRACLVSSLVCSFSAALYGASSSAITSPAPGSTLSGSSVTFTWSPATGASHYILYLGTTGANSRNVFSSGSLAATSVTVSGLPQNGLTIYARLYWQVENAWKDADYTFKESDRKSVV